MEATGVYWETCAEFFQEQLTEEYQQRVREIPAFGRTQDLLESIPSLGVVFAGTILTETRNFHAIMSGRQRVAYAGIAPTSCQSGSTELPRHISKAGNSRLRRAAYLAAVCATRTRSPFATFYQRLIAAGKPPKVALIALARKILLVAYGVVRSGTPYNVDHVS